MKIVVVAGVRPQFPKAAVVLKALQEHSSAKVIFLHAAADTSQFGAWSN